MSTLHFMPENCPWLCAKCRKPLEPKETRITYLGASFNVALPCCPDCGEVLVFEELATGRMLEVEKLLEDK